ncbi:MAG: hypothetical protein KBD96_03955 [Brachymonas sp.]|jgi:hypothetical protein|nr:hypothetical protein [Brachymonas sp.]MBP6966617.1 hypothetical protein [Brachymonas sp.]MBP7246581.1 hypothetical protein [Brachymonas sp.]MBP7740421.1 hypothetical protein [Brachymonas sp.]MBP8597051.1 hypothetical protein [Brachymonas sp.]
MQSRFVQIPYKHRTNFVVKTLSLGIGGWLRLLLNKEALSAFLKTKNPKQRAWQKNAQAAIFNKTSAFVSHAARKRRAIDG